MDADRIGRAVAGVLAAVVLALAVLAALAAVAVLVGLFAAGIRWGVSLAVGA